MKKINFQVNLPAPLYSKKTLGGVLLVTVADHSSYSHQVTSSDSVICGFQGNPGDIVKLKYTSIDDRGNMEHPSDFAALLSEDMRDATIGQFGIARETPKEIKRAPVAKASKLGKDLESKGPFLATDEKEQETLEEPLKDEVVSGTVVEEGAKAGHPDLKKKPHKNKRKSSKAEEPDGSE